MRHDSWVTNHKKIVMAIGVACTPESGKIFIPIAYYYGKKLHKELNVPIGLILTSWGGSTAQAWVKK